MTRVKTGVTRRRRHKKTLGMTKGHQGVRHRLYRRAHESLIHAGQYSFDHRKKKKGDMRRLWNIRINAGARARSEEHTSELQSLVNLVFRLLPETKIIVSYISFP